MGLKVSLGKFFQTYGKHIILLKDKINMLIFLNAMQRQSSNAHLVIEKNPCMLFIIVDTLTSIWEINQQVLLDISYEYGCITTNSYNKTYS